MSYLINKSDGTVLATVADGQIDNLTTDLTLIGKNYSGFGEALNENFVKLLENFSSVSRPTHPIRGQMWFDVTELKLKVYNGTAFQPVSSATISNTQPTTLTPGDLWFNDVDKQLYFYDGISTLLLGPVYATSQGLSGIKVSTILDSLNQNKVVTSLYSNGTLIGIFSSNENEFIPKIPIAGFTGSIVPGFNPGTITGFKFNVTSTNAENLGGLPGTTYIRNDTSSIINGRLGLIQGTEIGDAQQVKLFEVNGDLLLQNVSSNKFIRINARRGSTQEDAIVIEPATQTIKFYDGFINSETTIGGNLTVSGNLNVLGDTVSVDVSTLRVENKNIELGTAGDSSVLTDEQADAGGIILRGDSDHELLWSNSKRAWVSTENIDLIDQSYFSIDGVPLLKKTGDTFELTNRVTLATGISIFGVQEEFTVNQLYLNSNRLSILAPSNDLELAPNSGNVVLIGSPKITGLGEPADISDAATKNYVDTQIKAKSLVLSLDISDGISNTGIAGYLEQIAPVSEYDNGTVARILCSSATNLSTDVDLNTYYNPTTNEFLNYPTGHSAAIINATFTTVPIPGSAITITRTVKTFQIIAGAWMFVS